MKYNQTEHKIKIIWGETDLNEELVHLKDTEFKKLFLQGNEILPAITIYDSGWIHINPQKLRNWAGHPQMWAGLNIDIKGILNIPEYLLPYIDTQTFVKNHDISSKVTTLPDVDDLSSDSNYMPEIFQHFMHGSDHPFSVYYFKISPDKFCVNIKKLIYCIAKNETDVLGNVSIKILVTLRNPMYFEEIRRYTTKISNR